MRRSLPLLLAALALVACNSLGADAVGITGTWEGVVEGDENPAVTYPVELRLRDTGASVSGTGFVELPGERFEFSIIEGQFLNGVVNLRLQYEVPPFKGAINGRLTETSPGRIEGTLAGRGEANGPIDVELVAR